MFDLTTKTALVTGASGGIGRAIATALHQAGATVALTGRNADALQTLATALGERTHVLPADLSDPAAADALIKSAEAAMGRLDILVNNAGQTKDTLILRMKDEDWESVIAVNLTSAFRLSRAAVRGMIKHRFGRILNITSVVGVTGNAGQVNYAASKAGMIGFSKSLAQEVASRNVTVNCIAPGFIVSAMTDALTDDQKARIDANIPARRMGTAAEVATAAVFLASPEAAYITGQTLHINGGLAMI